MRERLETCRKLLREQKDFRDLVDLLVSVNTVIELECRSAVRDQARLQEYLHALTHASCLEEVHPPTRLLTEYHVKDKLRQLCKIATEDTGEKSSNP